MDDEIQRVMLHFKTLAYNEINDFEIQKKLQSLQEEIKCDEGSDISECILKVKSFMEKNRNVFHKDDLHVDMITTILDYLDYCANIKCKSLSLKPVVHDIIYKLSYIYGGTEIFDTLTKTVRLFDLPIESHSEPRNAIIVFEDADLYAIVDSWKIYNLNTLKKILVQEPLRELFLSFIQEHFEGITLNIEYFLSKSELMSNINGEECFTTISIWSENITAAKNLAMSIKNAQFFFINTYAVFGSNILRSQVGLKLDCISGDLYLRHHDINAENMKEEEEEEEGVVTRTDRKDDENSIVYDLFYGGNWRCSSIKAYWKRLEGDKKSILWSDTTKTDFQECIKLAKQGFKIWGSFSIDQRIEILENFASKLSSHRQNCVDKILRWIRTSGVLEGAILYSKNCTTEIMITRIPLGIIILTGEDEEFLLLQLVQALICGNAVIVISGRNLCSIVEYSNTFSQCNFPAGVINSLSCYKPSLLLHYAYKNLKKDISLIVNNYNKDDLCSAYAENDKTNGMILNALFMKFTASKCVLLGIK